MLDYVQLNTVEESVGGPLNTGNRILLIEDNGSTLKSVLTLSNYTVCKLKATDNIFKIARNFSPDLILSSFEEVATSRVIEQMREDHHLCHTPVIIIANRFNIKKAIKNLNGNVDDYIVKPFQPEELTARIGRIIHRHERALNSNPLTKLPGNISIKNEVERRLQENDEFCVCYADLDNFKAFNDHYGYEKGDEAIRLTSSIIKETISRYEKGNRKNFLGHIGGDDFIFITETRTVKRICEDIINGFDQKILSLYNKKDLKNGWIVAVDRNGKKNIFSIMSISISVVINHRGDKRHIGEFSKIGAELKKYIKGFPGSNYIVDRRCRRSSSQAEPVSQDVRFLQQRHEARHFDKRF